MEDQEGSRFTTISMPPRSFVLDMVWQVVDGSIYLVVLTTHGQHLYFPSHRVEGRFGLGNFLDELTFNMHCLPGPFKHGAISCYESTVASTMGHEVVVGVNMYEENSVIIFCPSFS